MAERRRKPTPREAFAANMEDALRLVTLSDLLTNIRTRRPRAEFRAKVGAALGIPRRDWDAIECIESQDLWVIISPHSEANGEDLGYHDPMLRQAIVAGAAAFETFLADRVVAEIRRKISAREQLPAGLDRVRMDVGQWRRVGSHGRPNEAITSYVLEPHIRMQASCGPDKDKELLKLAGASDPLSELDRLCGRPTNGTAQHLERVRKRRNAIAHTGDRSGRGRAPITKPVVKRMLSDLTASVDAIDELFPKSKQRTVEDG